MNSFVKSYMLTEDTETVNDSKTVKLSLPLESVPLFVGEQRGELRIWFECGDNPHSLDTEIKVVMVSVVRDKRDGYTRLDPLHKYVGSVIMRGMDHSIVYHVCVERGV